MNIVLGEENIKDLSDRHIVLELDSFLISGSPEPVKSFCIVEKVSLEFFSATEQFQTLHANLVENYRRRQWKYCQDAISHLRGQWCGELDSFYDDLAQRIVRYKESEPCPDWNGVIDKRPRDTAA